MELPRINDRWLWIGFGIAGFIAVRAISYGLHEVRRLNEIREDPSPASGLSAETEDGTVSLSTNLHEIPIKLQSLQALATSPNYDIRKAAAKILLTRFLGNTSAKDLLKADLESSDPEIRETARRAVALIERHHGWNPDFAVNSYNAVRPDGRPYPRRTRPLSEESPEEQEVRRRRREAMVLNEGDRPVSQDDIIEAPRREWTHVHTQSQNAAQLALSPTMTSNTRLGGRSRSASDPHIRIPTSPLNNENAVTDRAVLERSTTALAALRELREARRATQATENQTEQISDGALREITSELTAMDREIDRLLSAWRDESQGATSNGAT